MVCERGRCTCSKAMRSCILPLPLDASLRWFILLDHFILIQGELGVFASLLSFPIFRAISSKLPEKPSTVSWGHLVFPLKSFGWLDEFPWRWRKELWEIGCCLKGLGLTLHFLEVLQDLKQDIEYTQLSLNHILDANNEEGCKIPKFPPLMSLNKTNKHTS